MNTFYLSTNRMMMQTIKIPPALRELFGVKITLVELVLTLFTCVAVSISLLVTTFEEWRGIPLWRQILLILLVVDESGGIIANFSFSTNLYYKENAKARLTFILWHIQPLILAFLLGSSYRLSIVVVVYTMISALIVNALYRNPAQRVVGGAFMILGVSTLLLNGHQVLTLLLTLFTMHMFKVIYGFAVDHYASRLE